MTWEGFEVIHSYTDTDAIEDGTLIDISGRLDPFSDQHVPNARVTVSIFYAFAELARRDNVADVDTHARTTCQFIYRAMLRQPADADGWRKTQAHQDGETIGEVWLIPNEVGGLTLMLPSDY